MASFERKYTDAQRNAVVRTLLDEGASCPDTLERAASGSLGVPAFTMPLGTAYRLVAEERERRRRQHFEELLRRSPEEAIEELRRRQIAALAELSDKLWDRARQEGKIDAPQLRGVLRCLRQLRIDGTRAARTGERDPKDLFVDVREELALLESE